VTSSAKGDKVVQVAARISKWRVRGLEVRPWREEQCDASARMGQVGWSQLPRDCHTKKTQDGKQVQPLDTQCKGDGTADKCQKVVEKEGQGELKQKENHPADNRGARKEWAG
jgi:hypothetical protein